MALTDGILAYWNLNNDGSGGVSLLDSTGNGNTLTNNNGVTLGTGIIAGDAVFNGSDYLSTNNTIIPPSSDAFSVSLWCYLASGSNGGVLLSSATSGPNSLLIQYYGASAHAQIIADGGLIGQLNATAIFDAWVNYVLTYDSSGNAVWYQNGTAVDSGNYPGMGIDPNGGLWLGRRWDGYNLIGQIDEVGIWNRVLSPTEVSKLYNNGSGKTYPFNKLYYNNAQNDGDWGNLLNWWQDSGFTIQATELPTATNPVNLYSAVTQNTVGANQCFCSSANFWSANFGAGLTLQASGVVNMQGTSLFAGTTTDGVSMHDSSQLTATSVIDGNVTMRDSSRAFGSILGNATIYYDGGNGQYPIGGTVAGSVTYLGWPAVTPQWFNDQATGGADDGDFSNQANWWTNNTYTVRPINAEGAQELPDASTDVFIAPNTGIVANSGASNPTVKSVTANNSNIQNISLTATNGFLFSGNEGVANAVLYGDVVFQDTAYNDHAVINGKATYKSAASLQYSWGQNSLGNVNAGMYNGSTSFEVNISGGGGGGTISRLLNLPWFINI
jgi:hypothetical protein